MVNTRLQAYTDRMRSTYNHNFLKLLIHFHNFILFARSLLFFHCVICKLYSFYFILWMHITYYIPSYIIFIYSNASRTHELTKAFWNSSKILIINSNFLLLIFFKFHQNNIFSVNLYKYQHFQVHSQHFSHICGIKITSKINFF